MAYSRTTSSNNRVRSISRELTLGLVVTIIIVSTVAILISYLGATQRSNAQLAKQVTEYTQSLSKLLEVPLWNLTAETIEHIGKLYTQYEFVEGVTISDNSGHVFFDAPAQSGQPLIHKTDTVYYQNQPVGYVELTLSPITYQTVNQQVLRLGIIIILSNLLALMIVTGFLLRMFLRKPIEQLSEIVNAYAAAPNSPPEYSMPYIEFQPFVALLDEMNTKIMHYRHGLEELVAQRTHELSQRNNVLEQEIAERKRVEKALRHSEERYRLLAENSSDVIWTLDLAGKFTYVSPSVERLRGYTPEEVMQQPMSKTLTPESLKIAEEGLRTIYQPESTSAPYRSITRNELEQPCKDGSTVWTEAITSVMRDNDGKFLGILGVTRDITERKQAEFIIQKANIELKRRVEELATLNRITQTLTSTLDFETVLNSVAREMVHLLDTDDCGLALLNTEQTELIVVAEYSKIPNTASAVGVVMPLDDNPDSRQIIKTRQPIIRVAEDINIVAKQQQETLDNRQIECIMVLPLMARNQVIGTIGIDSRQPGRKFTEHELGLAETVAGQLAGAIDNARLFEQEQEQRKMAENLREVTTNMISILDREAVLPKMLEQLQQVIPHDGAAIFLRDDDQLLLTTGDGIDNSFIGHRILLSDNIPETLVFNQMQPMVISDVRTVEIWCAWKEDSPIRAWMGAPLFVGEKTIGILAVYNYRAAVYRPQDSQILQIFANQAAIAIENARLFKEEQQHREVTDSLRQVATALNSSPDYETVIDKILEQLHHVIRYDSAGIFLQDGDDLLLTGGDGLGKDVIGYRIPLDSKIRTAYVFNHRQPQIIPDVLQDPYWEQKEGSEQIRSWMATPLAIGNEVVGVLTVDSFQTNSYREDDVIIAQAFANQATVAIRNARQIQRTEEALHETRTLYRIGNILAKTPDMQQGIEKALGHYLKALNLEQGGISLFDFDLTGGKLHALYQNGQPRPIGQTINIRSAVYQHLIATRKPVPIFDAYNDPFLRDNRELTIAFNIKSILFVPLIARGQVIGALGADTTTTHRHFSTREINLAQAVADQIASAIENSRLFEEEHRQRQIAEQTLTKLKATQKQLIHQEKMASLGVLTAGIAHEIKNPLNFVNNFAVMSIELARDLQEMLTKIEIEGPHKKEVNETINNLVFNAEQINESGRRADRIVRSMLLHARGKTGHKQTTDINHLLDEAIHLTYHSMRAKINGFDATIKTGYDPAVEPLPVITQDLSRVFVNIASNACDAVNEKRKKSGDEYQPILKVSTQNLGDRIKITIWDNGVGLAPDAQEKLFNPFFTTKPTGEGTGLGLSISYETITQAHEGSININSKEGEFTEFVITLPKHIQ